MCTNVCSYRRVHVCMCDTCVCTYVHPFKNVGMGDLGEKVTSGQSREEGETAICVDI